MAALAPAWLTNSFLQAMQGVGAAAGQSELKAEAHRLAGLWSTRERSYHDIAHLTLLLNAIDELGACVHSPDELRVATWYHGCVMFAPQPLNFLGCGEDLAAGTAQARLSLERLGVPAATVARIAQLIEYVRTDSIPDDDIDAQVFGDVFLTPLRLVPQEYKAYRDRVRGEYGTMSDRVYLLGRRRRVCSLLDKDALFCSPLASEYEELARGNLTAELKRLNQQLGEDYGIDEDGVDPKELPPGASGQRTGTVIIKKKTGTQRRVEAAQESAATPPQGVSVEELKSAVDAEQAQDSDAADISSMEAVEDVLDAISPRPLPASKPRSQEREAAEASDAEGEKAAPEDTSSPDPDSVSPEGAEGGEPINEDGQAFPEA